MSNVLQININRSGRVLNSGNLSLTQFSSNNVLKIYSELYLDEVFITASTSQSRIHAFYESFDGSNYVYSCQIGDTVTGFPIPAQSARITLTVYGYTYVDNIQQTVASGSFFVQVIKSDSQKELDQSYNGQDVANIWKQLGKINNDIFDTNTEIDNNYNELNEKIDSTSEADRLYTDQSISKHNNDVLAHPELLKLIADVSKGDLLSILVANKNTLFSLFPSSSELENGNIQLVTINEVYKDGDIFTTIDQGQFYVLNKSGLLLIKAGISSIEFANKLSDYYTKEEVDDKLNTLTQNAFQTITCDHEYEITGNTGDEHGLAVKDQQMILTKIEGQTGRYSENLIKLQDVDETTKVGVTYSVKDGVITLNGTANGNDISFVTTLALQPGSNFKFSCFSNLSQSSSTWQFWVSSNDPKYILGSEGSIADFSQSNVFQINLALYTGAVFNNVKLYPMLVIGNYNTENFPLFKPFDNTLVNSKCNLISTNKNWCNTNNVQIGDLQEGTFIDGTKYVTDYIKVLPNTQFTRSSNCNIGSNEIAFYDINKNYINRGFQSTFTTPLNCYYIRMEFDSTVSQNEVCIMLNYGSETQPYQQYEQDTFILNEELGQFDYIDNVSNKLYKQTSDIITLNGTEDWYTMTTTTSGKPRFSTTVVSGSDIYLDNNTVNVASNFIDKHANNTWNCETGISLGDVSNPVFVYVEGITTVEAFKQWLQANPITFVYKKKTATITDINLPAGYQVWNGGLQEQVINGKYLPYILTKEYSVSIADQLAANREIDRDQQEQLNVLNQTVLGLGMDKAESIAITTESEIVGQTGDTFGLNLNNQLGTIDKIYGKSGRYSENLIKLDNRDFTNEGITAKYENGIITYNGTVTSPTKYTNFYYTISDIGTYTYINYGNASNAMIVKNADGSIADYRSIDPNIPYVFTIDKQNIYEVRFYNQFDYQDTKTNYIIKPMLVKGTYTSETMPIFKPFDNTLVNAKCNIITTNKNLYSGQGQVGTAGFSLLELNEVPLGTYKLTFKATNINKQYDIRLYYGDTYKTTNQNTTKENNTYTINIINRGVTKIYFNSYGVDYGMSEIMLEYSTSVSSYEQYNKNTFIINEELGEWDYIDNKNNKKYKQTSDIWKWNNSMSFLSGGKYTYGYRVQVVELPNTEQGETQGVSNWEYSFSSISGPDNANQNSICIFNKNIYIFVSGATSESEARAKLNENPPQLVYKLATPTITESITSDGIQITSNGLLYQEVTGKYLPYKQYDLSLSYDIKEQISKIIEINKAQQEQIDALNNSAAPAMVLLNDIKSDKLYFIICKVDFNSKSFNVSNCYFRLLLNEDFTSTITKDLFYKYVKKNVMVEPMFNAKINISGTNQNLEFITYVSNENKYKLGYYDTKNVLSYAEFTDISNISLISSTPVDFDYAYYS